MADNVTGIVLDIPPTVLQNIKNADKAIKDLEQTSKKAAQNIKRDFDTTMVSGVEAFIKKVQEAQTKLGGLKMPTIDASGLSSAIQALSQAMATIDKSATTGSNRLTRIANAMTALQTANPDPQLFQNIADGIAKIGNTSQQTIDNVRNLSQIMAQLAKDIRTVQQAQNAQNANTATAAQYNKLFKEQADLVRRINEIKSKGADADGRDLTLLNRMRARYDEINQQLDKLNRKKQTAASELARTQGYNRVGDAQARTDVSGAINYAKQAKSLQELQVAYKNLKAVMATVDPKTSAWRQMNTVLGQTRTRIDEIKEKMGEFKSHASQVGDVAGQLKRTLAATFSISAITGYINKLIETRAQFELQQTALRAILQDKQKADEIFQQVQQMALQSPFSIMQLTTYTKQLAAYRVEADKLVGTTKMLADVSAGLGVDIQRLILAFGQVKAANYLRACLGRGTKVKMFDGTFKNVEDVVVGDVLMGDDEQPRHVSKLYQGEQQMYRVSYLGGSFRCNEHHILTVYDALTMRVSDVFVLDYLKEPYRYHGVKRIGGEYKTFIMKVEPDNIDTYYGFSIDGNHRFIIEDNIVTHNTEVRQFTEAGLNIADELATYFSELQGKMISVGDVMEMITKRMVRFEDVEEVFKRVTSAGGLFYDMQKKQSETLWGQLQRIKDAMSIMFNEIGKSNQGAISWFLKAIRELINSWRTLAPIINIAGAALVTYMVAGKAIPAMVAGLKALKASWIAVTAAIKAADAAGKAAAASNPYGILATAAAALLMTIYQLVTAQSALNEELGRISGESSKDMWDLIFKFREGAEAVRDTTKSYNERQKALEDLQNTFRGILPDQDLEYNNIIRITDGYKGATETIKAYSAEKAKQAAVEAINTEKQKQWTDFTEGSKDILAPLLSGAFMDLSGASEASLRGLVGNIMMKIQSEVESGAIKSGQAAYDRFMQELNTRFKGLKGAEYGNLQEALKGVFNVDNNSTAYIAAFQDVSILWKQNFTDMLTYAQDKQQEFAEQYKENTGEMTDADLDSFNNFKANYELRKKVLEDFQAALLAYQEARKNGDIDAQGNATNEAGQGRIADLEKVTSQLNHFLTVTGEAAISWQDLKTNTDYETDALVYFDGVQKTVLGSFLQNIINAGGNKSIVNWAEETNRSLRKAGFQEMQIDIANTAKKWGLLSGVSSAVMNKIKIDANTNYTSAAKDAKALSDEAQENILKITQTTLAFIEMGRKSGQVISHAQAQARAEKMFETTIEEEKKTKEWASELAKLWGNVEKSASKAAKSTKKAGGGGKKDIWTPRLELIKKINTEYKKLLKYYSQEEAIARIRTSYGDAVAAKFGKTAWADITKWDGFDDKATIKRLKDVGAKSGKEYKAKFLEAAGTIQTEIDIKIEEKKIQEAKDKIQSLFDNYELTKTLSGLGLNIDLTYLVGGRPVKLEDLRKQLEQELSTVKATGGEEDTVKAYEDALRKVTDLENKAAVERLKNYKKYLAMMYSDRAKAMIKSYTMMKNMEQDFADYRAKLEKEASDPATSAQRKQEISQQIAMLETQARDAIKGVKDELDNSLNKLDWEAFKGSPVFTQMYSDLEILSKKGIDLLITKLTTMRDKLQAMDNVDYRAVREITKYIEKLNTQRIEVDSWRELNAAIKEANALRKEGSDMDKAQSELMSEQANLDAANAEIANLQTIINLKQQEGTVESKTKNLSADQLKLYDLSEDELQKMLSAAKDNANTAQANMLKWSGVVATLQKGKKALNEQLKRIKMLHDDFGKVYDSAIDLADALGADTEIWGDFAKGVGDSIFQVIELTIQLKIMGDAANSALGVIGYIAIALQAVASLFASIFRAGDKRKEKQIQRLQYKVEDLQKAYEKLQTAIEEAYAFDDYNAGYNQSMRNLQEQREAIQEQLALESAKKKSDKDKIREYEDALDELANKEKELREARYEAMGSVGEKGIRPEAENFVSAWLDAYKETGDGLDALKDHWDEFFQNLVLKQAASAVVSRRMKKYVDQINAAIDSGATGLSLSQTFAQIGQELKSELGDWNEDLKAFFDAVGIKGGQGELLLSDLQKGIQNITEPQAAAIEAYLNSMRFAVFEQNNILTEMLSAIQAQYGSNDNSPMLQEVRAIRSLVASIDDRLSRVIVQRSSVNTGYAVMVK